MALGDSRRARIRSEMSETHSFLRALAPARTSRSRLARAGSHIPRVYAHVAGVPNEGCRTLAVPTTASLRKLLRRAPLEKVERKHRSMQLNTALQHPEALEVTPRLGALIDVAPQEIEPHCGRAKPDEEVSSAPRMGEEQRREMDALLLYTQLPGRGRGCTPSTVPWNCCPSKTLPHSSTLIRSASPSARTSSRVRLLRHDAPSVNTTFLVQRAQLSSSRPPPTLAGGAR